MLKNGVIGRKYSTICGTIPPMLKYSNHMRHHMRHYTADVEKLEGNVQPYAAPYAALYAALYAAPSSPMDKLLKRFVGRTVHKCSKVTLKL
jgi:hypothetical protein